MNTPKEFPNHIIEKFQEFREQYPEKDGFVITSDGTVFFPEKESFARAHAHQNHLDIYFISETDDVPEGALEEEDEQEETESSPEVVEELPEVSTESIELDVPVLEVTQVEEPQVEEPVAEKPKPKGRRKSTTAKKKS